jgi:hypothetical protein
MPNNHGIQVKAYTNRLRGLHTDSDGLWLSQEIVKGNHGRLPYRTGRKVAMPFRILAVSDNLL